MTTSLEFTLTFWKAFSLALVAFLVSFCAMLVLHNVWKWSQVFHLSFSCWIFRTHFGPVYEKWWYPFSYFQTLCCTILNDVQAWYCPAARATPHSFCLTFSHIIHPFKVFFNWSQVFRKHWLGWLDLAVFWQLLHFFSPSPISTA